MFEPKKTWNSLKHIARFSFAFSAPIWYQIIVHSDREPGGGQLGFTSHVWLISPIGFHILCEFAYVCMSCVSPLCACLNFLMFICTRLNLLMTIFACAVLLRGLVANSALSLWSSLQEITYTGAAKCRYFRDKTCDSPHKTGFLPLSNL